MHLLLESTYTIKCIEIKRDDGEIIEKIYAREFTQKRKRERDLNQSRKAFLRLCNKSLRFCTLYTF